ncbi:MAG TPA: glycogen-binding domain-containing protein [Candidatus Cybelea sp.]|nr:glycogen-binding domain-containing protein [Candidatus Cybelea sp.]
MKTSLRPRSYGHNPNTTSAIGMVFRLNRPEAKIVFVCGDFNDWSPRSLRMFRRGGRGEWERTIPLEPGRYQYKFIVDGEWMHDPKASENIPNGHGSLNSIMEVRAGQQASDYDHAPRSIPSRCRND